MNKDLDFVSRCEAKRNHNDKNDDDNIMIFLIYAALVVPNSTNGTNTRKGTWRKWSNSLDNLWGKNPYMVILV